MKFREHYFTEKFGMESIYSLPKDKEQQLFDFYALTMFNPSALMDEEAEMFFNEAKETVINGLQKSFIDALYTAIAAELFHTKDQAKPFHEYEHSFSIKNRKNAKSIIESQFTPEEIALIDDISNEYDYSRGELDYDQRAKIFKEGGYSPEKLYKFAKKVFNLDWYGGYGGKKWKQIAEGLERLIDSKSLGDKMVAIDHAYDLQHNNDTVFNKVKKFAKHGSYSWLKRALDLKAKIKEPHVYLNNISSQLYRPLAYAFKKLYNKTLEDFTRQQAENRETNKKRVLELWAKSDDLDYIKRRMIYSSLRDNSNVSSFARYDSENDEIINTFYISHDNNGIQRYRNDPEYFELETITPEKAKEEAVKIANDAKKLKPQKYKNELKDVQYYANVFNKNGAIYYDIEDDTFENTFYSNAFINKNPGDIFSSTFVLMKIVTPKKD